MQQSGWGPRRLLSSQALSRPCLPSLLSDTQYGLQVVWSFDVCFSGMQLCLCCSIFLWKLEQHELFFILSVGMETQSPVVETSVSERSVLFIDGFFSNPKKLRSFADGQSQLVPQSESWVQTNQNHIVFVIDHN